MYDFWQYKAKKSMWVTEYLVDYQIKKVENTISSKCKNETLWFVCVQIQKQWKYSG